MAFALICFEGVFSPLLFSRHEGWPHDALGMTILICAAICLALAALVRRMRTVQDALGAALPALLTLYMAALLLAAILPANPAMVAERTMVAVGTALRVYLWLLLAYECCAKGAPPVAAFLVYCLLVLSVPHSAASSLLQGQLDRLAASGAPLGPGALTSLAAVALFAEAPLSLRLDPSSTLRATIREKGRDMECNRRNFLKTAATMGGAATLGALTTAAPALADEGADPVVTELDVPGDSAAPETTAYECDVLVVGGGWAGLHAAVTAKKAGANVVLADKGLPGYSGLAPFAAGCTYYDPDWDEYEGTLKAVTQTGEYIANVDNFAHDMENSRAAYEENVDFGIVGGYLNAPASGYPDYTDDKAYFQANIQNERHHKWMEVLDANEIPVADHVMVTELLTADDGRVCGAVGLHFQSSTIVTFAAKAVVLCTGGGSYKPAGYVTSGDTFDSEYMAYQHGLTIVGKEFDDFHQTTSYQPGDYYYNNTWDYVEPYAPYASFSVADDAEARNTYASGKASYMSINRINQALFGLAPSGDALTGSWRTMASHGVEKEATDPRALLSAEFGEGGSNRKSDTYGACPGMQTHMNCGIFCGWDDHDGATPLPGLYCAGDGIYGDMSEGCMYCFIGTTTTHCSVQGNMAGAAAAAYAAGVEAVGLPQDQVDAITEEIYAPTKLEKGFDPNYVVNQLQATMIAPQIQLARDASSLNAALTQVEYLRDNVVPKMMGYTGHDLRICLEAKHKVLSAEMKLRATLAREESLGMHYRTDFPYRDDENFLCHLGVSKAADGSVQVDRIDIPDSWKGDTTLPYDQRYVWRFPGEAEALGISAEGMYEHQG